MTDSTPYLLLGEQAGIRKVVDRFYCIMDESEQARMIRDMHAADLTPMCEKLTDYLCEWLGGPKLYSQKTGTVCLTKPHSHFKIDEEARDEWLYCIEQALLETDASDEVRDMLRVPFQRIADIMRNA
jgi:hemoglobin